MASAFLRKCGRSNPAEGSSWKFFESSRSQDLACAMGSNTEDLNTTVLTCTVVVFSVGECIYLVMLFTLTF